MKQDFLNYIQDTFGFPPDEMQDFEACLIKPLKKSIRINTNKISISDFEKLALKNKWELTPTGYGKNTFYIDRFEDLDTALGNTFEHLAGYFYVQEVAASTSPYYLADDTIDDGKYLILDMSASPGGKSTQLSEYFPNSLILANEIDKTRLRALEENIDRMGAKNILVTNYDGRHFKNTPETFDKILLDAPCSGEGTSFKTDDALKFWNLKNIEKISLLQLQLLESALVSLKIGGELVYSTCTLNKLENEEIIERILSKYPQEIEVISLGDSLYKRNWPHREKTGGFFVAKIRKTKSISIDCSTQKFVQQNFEKLQNKQEKLIENFLEKKFGYSEKYSLFKYRDDIFLSNKGVHSVWEKYFFYKMGIHIGTLKNGVFEPGFFFGTLKIFDTSICSVDGHQAAILLKGYEIEASLSDGYYQVLFPENIPLGIGKVKHHMLKSFIPTKMIRK